jgi:hypothetical protein
MAIVVDDDANIERILVLIAVIGIVIDEDIRESAKQFHLLWRLPEQPSYCLVLVEF